MLRTLHQNMEANKAFPTKYLHVLVSSDCWHQDPHKRPSFKNILEELEEISEASFEQESFRTMQESWQNEIEEIFEELRQKEKVEINISTK